MYPEPQLCCCLQKLDDRARIPQYAHSLDAGMDVYPLESFKLLPFDRQLIKLGFAIAIPDGYEIQVRSRSGLALKKGVFVLNSPGTVDAGYRGEVGVILANFSDTIYSNDTSQAIAQLVLAPVIKAVFVTTKELEKSGDRDVNGFGSTDKNVQK